jgi:hypothetical protein
VSQLLLQQNGSAAQIAATHGSQAAVSAAPVEHLSCAQGGQSALQVAFVSPQAPVWHWPLPHTHTGGQSPAHVAEDSPHCGWQVPLPQTHGCPQSWVQVCCVSPQPG